jgi:hypothetical protein
VLAAAYYFFVRPRLLRAGATQAETTRSFPGDDLIATPNLLTTHAIDINAPIATVWMWIAQMGRGGTGFYGVDSLTNRGQPSAAYVRNDITPPQIGTLMDGGYRILDLEPERLLLYGGFDLPTPLGEPMERTTLFMLESLGSDKTRLIVRTRGYTGGPLGRVYNLITEITETLDSMVQINNIKQRAEVMVQLHATLS